MSVSFGGVGSVPARFFGLPLAKLDERNRWLGKPKHFGDLGLGLFATEGAYLGGLRGKKTQTEIAKMFGLTQPAVSFIQLGKRQTKETRWNGPHTPKGD